MSSSEPRPCLGVASVDTWNVDCAVDVQLRAKA